MSRISRLVALVVAAALFAASLTLLVIAAGERDPAVQGILYRWASTAGLSAAAAAVGWLIWRGVGRR